MTLQREETVGALRRSHDELAAIVAELGDGQLEQPSGASEWTVAQAFSHLGSAAEIGRHTLVTGQADMAAAPAIWDRWNAMPPEEQADGFVAANQSLVEAFEALSAEEWASRMVDVGFLPAPIDVTFLGSMRLTEVALHRWDIDVAFDDSAVVGSYLVPFILERLPLLAGFIAKPIGRPAKVAFELQDPVRSYVLDLTEEGASVAEGDAADAGT